MNQHSPDTKPMAKQAKIVKLNKLPSKKNDPAILHCSTHDESDFNDISFISFNQIDSSSLTHSSVINNSINSPNSFKYSSDSEHDFSGEFIEKLYIIKKHTTQLVYGGISVKPGEIVYLISQSEFYYLIENQNGIQGIVPKDVCVNIEKTVLNAKKNFKSKTKITSL